VNTLQTTHRRLLTEYHEASAAACARLKALGPATIEARNLRAALTTEISRRLANGQHVQPAPGSFEAKLVRALQAERDALAATVEVRESLANAVTALALRALVALQSAAEVAEQP
jgi:hypothetical protein